MEVKEEPERDVVTLADRYPGFAIDARKVELEPPSLCTPYGVPAGCRGDAALDTVRIGGTCDTWMQPVAGVP